MLQDAVRVNEDPFSAECITPWQHFGDTLFKHIGPVTLEVRLGENGYAGYADHKSGRSRVGATKSTKQAAQIDALLSGLELLECYGWCRNSSRV